MEKSQTCERKGSSDFHRERSHFNIFLSEIQSRAITAITPPPTPFTRSDLESKAHLVSHS